MTVLPIELRKYQHLRYIKKRGKMEWSSECVVCGDVGHRTRDWPDRFRMFAQGHQGRDARAFCRSCGHFEWANQRGKTLSPQQMLAIETERKRLAEEERARMQRKIERLERSAYWRGYHDSMGDNERRLWQKEGINNSYQDYFELGYDPNRKFYYEDELRSSPALTIPYFQPDEEKVKQIATVQFRLLEPVEPGDKYRFMSDLQAPLYLPDPHRKPQGVCLLVEGGRRGW